MAVPLSQVQALFKNKVSRVAEVKPPLVVPAVRKQIVKRKISDVFLEIESDKSDFEESARVAVPVKPDTPAL